MTAAELVNAAVIDIETDGVEMPRECHAERKPDIAQADDDNTLSPEH